MAAAVSLACTACEESCSLESYRPRCEGCGEPLEVTFARFGEVRIPAGGSMLERYFDLLPLDAVRTDLSLGEGNTPLLPSVAVAESVGLRSLYFKNETQNPTWSFKDRGTSVGLQHAIALGFERIGTVSTGNMAVSVAAYGSRAGLDTCVLVSSTIAEEKIRPIAIHSPNLYRVEGDYGELYFRSLELGERYGICFINSDVPFRVEGSKTIAFEICEQLGYEVPDHVVVPVSAGGNFRGIVKGFEELLAVGLTDRMPHMVAGQAEGCSPIVDAFQSGRETVEHVARPATIAHAIENPFPPSGNQTLRKLREHGGTAVKVPDSEIVEAQGMLAGEGIFGQPAAAVPLAVVRRLVSSGAIAGSDRVVCVVTGGGLKYGAALDRHPLIVGSTTLDRLEEVLQG